MAWNKELNAVKARHGFFVFFCKGLGITRSNRWAQQTTSISYSSRGGAVRRPPRWSLWVRSPVLGIPLWLAADKALQPYVHWHGSAFSIPAESTRLCNWHRDWDLFLPEPHGGSFSTRPVVLSRVIESGHIDFICCALSCFRLYFFFLSFSSPTPRQLPFEFADFFRLRWIHKLESLVFSPLQIAFIHRWKTLVMTS